MRFYRLSWVSFKVIFLLLYGMGGDSELIYTHPISNMQKQVNLPITVDSREKAQVLCFFIFDSLILNQKKPHRQKPLFIGYEGGKTKSLKLKKNPKVVGFIFFLALLKKPKRNPHHSGAFPEYPLYVDTFWRYKHYFKTSENVWRNQRQTQRPKLQWSK